MLYDTNNIFARILRGEIPCNKIYEDDFVLSFHDINPQARLHVLIIPKGSYIDFSDFVQNATSQEIDGFFKAVAKIADDLGVTEEGYRILANKGNNGGQEVPHFHVHLFAGEKLGAMLG